MKLSKESRKLSRQFFRSSLTNGLLDATKVSSVTDFIIEAKPRQYVALLKEYSRMIRLEVARRHASITSAVDLSPAEQESVASRLRERSGADLTFSFTTDPSLIGGLKVQVGSDVWDSTVLTRLNRLAEEFSR